MLARIPGRYPRVARGAGVAAPPPNAARMPTGGDSRSLFVVQRAFRPVRRGYDPEGPPRPLQRAGEWCSRGRGGRTAREVEQQLVARETATADAEANARRLVEDAHVEERATLEGARGRAPPRAGGRGRGAARRYRRGPARGRADPRGRPRGGRPDRRRGARGG